MAYADAMCPGFTRFERLVIALDECRRMIVRGIGLGIGAAAAVAATMAFVTILAAAFVATALSANPHLNAKAPFGTEHMAFGNRYRIEIAATDRVAPNEVMATSAATDDITAPAVAATPVTPIYVLASAAPALPTSVERANFISVRDPSDDAASDVKVTGGNLSVVPKSQRPEADDALVTASISPAMVPPKRPRAGEIWLRDVHHRTAVYDIAGHTVYMPDGTRLEAHSGLGAFRDDPAHIRKKMRGPTPPNVYELTMRERLFHGVRAIRLNPARGSTMFGRDGMLAHTYMLGANGQSNGCVSFKNYSAFLRAFLRGEVTRMVVVPRLGNTDMAILRNAQRTSIE